MYGKSPSENITLPSSGFRKNERAWSTTSREHAGMCEQRSFSGDVGATCNQAFLNLRWFKTSLRKLPITWLGCSVIPNEKTVELIFQKYGSIIKYVKTYILVQFVNLSKTRENWPLN